MECCKEKKYDLTVKVGDLFSPTNLTSIMTEHLNFSKVQCETVISLLESRQSCILITDNMEVISAFTPILVQNNIGFEVRPSK